MNQAIGGDSSLQSINFLPLTLKFFNAINERTHTLPEFIFGVDEIGGLRGVCLPLTSKLRESKRNMGVEARTFLGNLEEEIKSVSIHIYYVSAIRVQNIAFSI